MSTRSPGSKTPTSISGGDPSRATYAAFGFAATAAVETKDETIALATEGLAKAAKQFSVPEDRVTTHVAVGDPKIRSRNLLMRLTRRLL